MTQDSKRNEHGFEYAVLIAAGILALWVVAAESAALIGGAHRWLPNLSSAFHGLYGLVSHGNPVSGWSSADRHDLPSPAVFFIIAALELATVVVGAWVVKDRGLLHKSGQDKSQRAPGRPDIKSHLSLTAIRERTSHLRDDINAWKAPPEHVGLYLGKETTTHLGVWAAGDDSILMVGPPGSGKTSNYIVPAIVEAPGAVVATSTRDEIVTRTAEYRMAKEHPAWVFAPQMDVDIPGVKTLQWSPLEGCEQHLTAITRATSLVQGGAGFGSSTTNADFWEHSGIAIMRAYLMAAAVGQRTMEDVLAWSTAPMSTEPVQILADHAPAWSRELKQMAQASSNVVGSVWAGVRRSLDCFADPKVLAACSVGTNFDIADFLEQRGTAYLIGSGTQQLSVAPLISALVEAIAEKARQPKGRGHLSTPMSLILDEAANIAPLPTLPSLLSDGGGSGIQVLVVLQSLAQARHRWSPAEMDAMWDASTIKIILAGMSHAQDLEAISKLCGEIEEIRTSKTTGAGGSGASEVPQMVPAWTPEQIRGLPTGHALVLHRRLRPVEIIAQPYWEREGKWGK